MPPANERIATLESAIRVMKGTLTVLVPTLLLWGWYITTNLIAIKQQLADGGNKQIVADLEHPKSSEHLKADLATVVAQVQTERANGKSPNANKARSLSLALAGVIQSSPQIVEGWQAAGELISFRYGDRKPETTSACDLDQPGIADHFREPPDTANFIYGSTISFQNCSIKLDDPTVAVKFGSIIARYSRSENRPMDKVFLLLHNVNVSYSGGTILPVTGIAFYDCSFDFRLNGIPPGGARAVTHTLLASVDTKKVVADVPRSS